MCVLVSGKEATDLHNTLMEGQRAVIFVRVPVDTGSQLVEPVDELDDLPDAIPANTSGDPRFRYLSRCADYVIRCRGGSVPASAHVLAVRSAYFKHLLIDLSTAASQVNAHTLDYPVEIVAPLVTYIHTDTFGLEPTRPLRSVLRMLRLVHLLEPSDEHTLKNGIANYARHRLRESETSVHDIALIAAIALELPFERLVICALKLIANRHYVAFREYYNEGSDDMVRQDVYTLLSALYENRRLQSAHDEHLVFPTDDEGFRPTAYIERIRETSFTTDLLWSQDDLLEYREAPTARSRSPVSP